MIDATDATWLCKHGPRGCDDCWGDEWMEKHYENKKTYTSLEMSELFTLSHANRATPDQLKIIDLYIKTLKERDGDTGQALQCEREIQARKWAKEYHWTCALPPE